MNSYCNYEAMNPTAYKAIGRVMKDHKSRERQTNTSLNALKKRPKVYVVSPYAGNVKENTDNAVKYCRFVIDKGYMPVASHLMYPQILNDSKARERDMGLMFGLALLEGCSEAWVFGAEMTAGMQQEVKEALKLRIPVKYIKQV